MSDGMHKSHHENEDFSNAKHGDRRGYWSRFKDALANMTPVVKGQVLARTADCHSGDEDLAPMNFKCHTTPSREDERLYYMDTFNDESWGCSFGTREHVSSLYFYDCTTPQFFWD
jgi:hypothetical protein